MAYAGAMPCRAKAAAMYRRLYGFGRARPGRGARLRVARNCSTLAPTWGRRSRRLSYSGLTALNRDGRIIPIWFRTVASGRTLAALDAFLEAR